MNQKGRDDVSFTERTSQKTAELSNAQSEVEDILEFLNRAESLCTPGFLLRRQLLQEKFRNLVDEAADGQPYADLKNSENVPWDPKLVRKLAGLLAGKCFDRCTSLYIEQRHWIGYLSDTERCQRSTMIKLAFALEMSTSDAEKFFLANGNPIFSLRDSFDYACKLCLTCGYSYEDAVSLFNDFESQRQQQKDNNFTQSTNGTFAYIKQRKQPFDALKSDILEVMHNNKDEFCFDGPGYSQQNLERMRLLLEYLKILYPTLNDYDDGTLRNLADDMLKRNGILNKEDVHVRNDRRYLRVPFNQKVLLPIRRLAVSLQSILRAVRKPANAKAVSRDEVLLLTYFFITGWKSAAANAKAQLEAQVNAARNTNNPRQAVVLAVEQILQSLDATKNLRAESYESLLTLMLNAFDLKEFYAPFVLDRFILFALVNKKMMSRVIGESECLNVKFSGGNQNEH